MSEATAKVLEDALALLDGGRKWTKGTLFDQHTGERCASGAIHAAGGGQDHDLGVGCLCPLLAKAIGGDRPGSLIRWNDAKKRTWPEVERAFLAAIAAERAS